MPSGPRMKPLPLRLLWPAATALLATAAAEAPADRARRGGRPEGSLIQTWRARLDGEAGEGVGAVDTPVAKVVNLLKEMSVTLRHEMEEDEAMYKQLGCWCGSNLQSKREAVDTAQAALSSLNATIESSASKSSELQQSIAQLQEEMATSKTTLAEASALREKESTQFHTMETDAIQNIEALKAAIVVLGKHHGEGPAQLQLPSLLAVRRRAAGVAGALSSEAGWGSDEVLAVQRGLKAAASFAQARHADEEMALASYAPASGEIFGLLKQLKDEMLASLNESQAEELGRRNTFRELRTSKQAEIAALEQQVEQKEDRLAQSLNDHAEANEDYHQTEELLSKDTQFLLNLQATCKDGEKSFEARKAARLQELEAVSDTIAILTSDEAQDAIAHTFGSGASFVQVGSRRSGDLRRERAASILRRAVAKGGSPDLSILATNVELDSFARVKKAIDDMISILKVEQADEVKKNDWCASQIQENEMETSKIDTMQTDLSSKVDDLSQQMSQLLDEVAVAKKQIEQLHVDMQKASENRKEENLDFQHTIADQRAVQVVLREALDRLKKFYAKGFLQTAGKVVDRHGAADKGSASLGAALLAALAAERRGPPPQVEYKPHGGSSGIVEMIEKLIQDATALEGDAVAGEQEAQAQYEATVADTSASVAALQKEAVSKTQMKAQASKEKADAEADAMDAAKELEELQRTNANLHGECDYLLKNFDARQEARSQEVSALQQAKQILSGANLG